MNILAPDTLLSFLGVKPTTNWLDYFFDRQKFSKVLRENPDESHLAIIADQFIEQALNSEKEVGAMEKKQVDFPEDIVKMRHKVEELWMFSCGCIAGLNWNLKLLLEKSNVQRVRAVLRKLLKWAFNLPNLDYLDDPFPQVLEFTNENFTRGNVFAAWIYARFILLIDSNGRFLTSAVKPTVSNPTNQVDQALRNAELFGQVTVELRRQMVGAVQLLEKILNLSFDSIIVPSFGCFYLYSEIIKEEKPLDELVKVPIPKLELSTIFLEQYWLNLKTNFDLMTAHFVARHFKVAREFSQKLSNIGNLDTLSIDIQKLLNIDQKQIESYKNSLRLDSTVSSLNIRDSLISTTRSRLKFDAQLECLKIKKSSVFTRRLFIQLKSPQNMKALAEEILKEIEKSRFPALGQNFYIAAYFLSAFVKGFSEIMQSLMSLNGQRNLNIRLRNFYTPSIIECSPLPPKNIVEGIITCGPPLWDVIASQNFHTIKQALLALSDQRFNFRLPHRYTVSELLGEPLLSRIPAANYDNVAIFLGKMEQQRSNLNLSLWEDFINKFGTDLSSLLANSPEFQIYLILEAVTVKMDIWNRRLFRTDDDTSDVNTHQLTDQIKKLLTPGSAAINILTKCMMPVMAYLVNLAEWPFIIQLDRNRSLRNILNRCNKGSLGNLALQGVRYSPTSPFYVVSLLLAHFMSAESLQRAQGVALGWWQMLLPTFEDCSRRQTAAQQMAIGKRQFMEFLNLIKDSKSIDFIMNYLIVLYNFVLGPPSDGERFPIDKRVFSASYNFETWRSVTFNITPDRLDKEYIEELFENIYKNALYINPMNAFWLRSFGDYFYAKGKSNLAARHYLEAISACTNSLTTTFPDNVVDDLLWTKLTRCCVELRMPTFGAIVGQMRRDLNPHLVQIESILAESYGSQDAGIEYFPLIGDVNLFEFMAAAYSKLNLNYYLEQLKKILQVKSLNPNNPYEISREEKERRKMKFMRVLCSHFFDRNI